jgi:UDP-glucose 4-epimerase
MRNKIQGANILVTGGAGFIGSHLVDSLILNCAKQVVVVDNLFLGKRANLKNAISDGVKLIIDDCEIEGTLRYIVERYNPDIIFNCATKALNYSFTNPLNAYMTNVNIVKNLLELQRYGAFGTLCHFSTSEVYGTAKYEPMDENHPFNPTTAYAAGKAATDMMVHAYVQQYGVDAFIVRPFNNYGERQNYEGALAGVIPTTVRRILNGESPVITGTGEQSRDFIYVHDTVSAIIKLYEVLTKGEVVNIATNGQISIKELIATVCKLLGYEGEIEYKSPRPADVKCHNASNLKLKELINFTPMQFTCGLEKTIEWYKKDIAGSVTING